MFFIDENTISDISKESTSFEVNLDSYYRRKTGSYYTSLELTIAMMKELIDNLPKHKRDHLYSLKFLEPCVGTGNFVFAYLIVAQSLNYSKEKYLQLIDNIYVCDINSQALTQYKQIFSRLTKDFFGITLTEDYYNLHVGGSLLFDVDSDSPRYISIDEVFGKGSENSFDIIATNPPYKNLKAERSQYPTIKECEEDKQRYAKIAKLASQNLSYSVSGVVNIYKLFVEEIVERYATRNAEISLLIPSSILTDKTCEKLRKRLLNTTSFHTIKVIAENNRFINAQQALSAILLKKGVTGKKIKVTNDYGGITEETTIVPIKDMLAGNNEHALLVLRPKQYKVLQKLNSYPKIRDLDFILNMRGELDLTTNKWAIKNEETPYPLLRGRHIGFYQLSATPIMEYVSPEFVNTVTKRNFIFGNRIICQQISNMAKERRLTFAPISENYVLGNSCNFITIKENEYDIDYPFMLGILNSSIMNWFFKLQSSNNHINNYEIGNFPIPVNYPYKEKLKELVNRFIEDNSKHFLIDEIDALVEEIFLAEPSKHTTPFDKLVLSKREEKSNKLSHNYLLNHTSFKLSELDLEMIRAVPQGGNWKNIPFETVAKSKRLTRINQTGGRTTLYGRIDYSKPSYTITTYFNRPGNGTYVHPTHDRVISVREAARFQAFPDDYFFCGNKTQMLNQVGNAVPPILAYQIAKQIIDITNCKSSLDLFCGAGGMTHGFKLAGIQSILCNDIDVSSCLTLKVNNPELNVICEDVTSPETKRSIIGKAQGVEIVCGGPPCQGFSMAGYRLADDPRNKLFLDFIDIVSTLKPKIVIFENVEGLLTIQQGHTYRIIHEMFGEIGYNTTGRVLNSSYYAVPQRRKRVFIICSRKDLSIDPNILFPPEITIQKETQITAYDAISDLESVECSEYSIANAPPISSFSKWARGIISIDRYLSIITSNKEVQDPQLKLSLEY